MAQVCAASGWCVPTVIYAVLSVISLILGLVTLTMPSNTLESSSSLSVSQYIMSVITTLIIGGLMYWLCKTCHKGWAWVLLLLPIILSVIFGIFIIILLASTQASINNRN